MRKIDYEETQSEFLIRKASDLVLVYPKNYSFIKNLRKKYIKKLKKHGWNVDETLFVEIPYVMTFSYELDPALVASYIMDAVPQKSYFKCLVLTRNYLPNAHFIEIEDTVVHEKIHLEEEEAKFLHGIIEASDPTLKKERRVHRQVSSLIEKQYGSIALKIKERSTLFSHGLQSREKTIVSGYLEYWLWRYLNENFEKYKELSFTSSPAMIEALKKYNSKFEKRIKQNYINLFNYEII